MLMAAPQVTGAVALPAAARPDITVAQVRAAILGSVDVVPRLADKVATLPFSDDFNRVDSTFISGYWTERSGDFQVVGNAVTSLSPIVSLMTENGISAADVSVRANISLAPSIASNGLSVTGLVARHSGPADSNWYVVSLVREPTGITGRSTGMSEARGLVLAGGT